MKKILFSIERFLYTKVLKPIFFVFDPEAVHDFVSSCGYFFGTNVVTRKLTAVFCNYQDKSLEQTVAGLKFKNPIGLAAGFDKDAKLTQILPEVGFGFEEVGSITAKAYVGNQKPRLYRLPEKQTLRVNYGLKNFGAVAVREKLSKLKFKFIVGISVAKTNNPETSVVAAGIDDYFFTYKTFADVGDYFTINISCPNTCEEKPIFAEPENLDLLLQKLFSIPKIKPVFVKLSPDLAEDQLMKILSVCQKYPVDGFVCTNLTKVNKFNHQGKGGFSGKAVEPLTNDLITKVYKFYGGKKIIIGCGGVFNARDAYKKIRLGANLVQLVTGMIFEGPQLIGQINQGIAQMLHRDGFTSITQAVGADNK
ncbi:MAG: quinone-dependent dihydroorotate dehydrogenase [Candidatus Doudnabacteria bacterium]|nr:quinone-dependent dihydroorotate dehydrogenase [Candidatus Doudnabacteria bacterium]